MNLKFTAVLFVLSLTCCKCGLLSWFSGWGDQLNPQNFKTNCKEKREAEENGIKPDITKPAADNVVSLMDIEEGKLTSKSERQTKTETHQGSPKAKRCHKHRYIVSAVNPLTDAAKEVQESLSLVKRDESSKEKCDACALGAECKILGKCAQCNKYCKGIAIYTDNILTPWTNQNVGMSNRLGSTKKDDIFSKTLYPISTFREGETKDIICRIVGITDTSDIETVTVWVTTFSNSPPKSSGGPKKMDNTREQNLRESKPLSSKMSTSSGQATSPDLQPRFNDNEDADGTDFQRITNSEKIKTNPDLIEGAPPFLRSSKLIVVQPKEFESDESDDDDEVVDDDVPNDTVPGTFASPAKQEATTSNNVLKPTFLSKLRELTTSKSNIFSNLKGLRQGTENESSGRGGFIRNLLRSRFDKKGDNSKLIISTPSALTAFQDEMENVERFAANENQISQKRRLGENKDEIAKINEAIQEVKSMVKNFQEENSMASEKRLLGATHIPSAPEDIRENNIPAPKVASPQPHNIIPERVADNFKKVNQFLINRAQDALNMIRPQEQNGTAVQTEEVGKLTDEHSDITKTTIANLKKMPQFLLEKFQETLSGFDNKLLNNSVTNVNSNSLTDKAATEKMELSERFGSGNPQENEENIKEGSIRVSSDDDNAEPDVLLKQSISENEISPKLETPTTQTYKNKVEKYLAELKEKRQKQYSSDKYLKSPSTKSNKISSIPNEEFVKMAEPSTNLNITPQQEDRLATVSSSATSPNDATRKQEILRKKLRQFIKDARTKTSSRPLMIRTDETTQSLSSTGPRKIIDNRVLSPLSNQDQSNNAVLGMKQQKIPDLKQSVVSENSKVTSNVAENDQAIAQENNAPVIGKTNPNNQEINNNFFLPTLAPFSINEINQNIETPNKFQKYLADLKAKQSSLLTPKKADNNSIESQKQDPDQDEQLGSQQELLQDKIKKYVENLQKPIQLDMSLNQRMADQISDFNRKAQNEMRNLLGSATDVSKKDVLKDKLRTYVESLKKPFGGASIQDVILRNSEAQMEELNSLKKKLENLLKANEPKSLVSETTDENSELVGAARQSTTGNRLEQSNDKTSSKDQTMDDQDVKLGSRTGITEEDSDILDWSHSLGKIVQSASKPSDIFFMGNGIKLPLKIAQGSNGSMDLSVDLDKLCSCYNATCPKNHTAIEETVGAILEKEAELNEQLKDSIDDAKIEPDRKGYSKRTFNNEPPVTKKFLDNLKSSNQPVRKKKSNIFKRSPDGKTGLGAELTTIKTFLEKLKKENQKNIDNYGLKDIELPKLPSLQHMADDLTEFGKKITDSVSNSVQQLTNNVEEIKEEMEDTFVGATQNSNSIVNEDLLNIPSYDNSQFQKTLEEIKEKVNKMNNNALEKLEHKNTLYNLLKENKLQKDDEGSLLNNYGLNLLNSFPTLSPENPLKKIQKQANDALKKIERQNSINKLKQQTDFSKFQMPQMPTYPEIKDPLVLVEEFQEKLKDSLPTIPELQNKIDEMNDDVLKITDAYQFGNPNILEKKLKELDNEVKKYYESNEKLLAEESKKLLGGHSNEIVEKEVNIVNRILSWIKSLASGVKTEHEGKL